MIIYENRHTDPYFNLAAEQYLMDTNEGEEIFMLWRNDASVIIGKNQNAYAELSLDFVRENNIKVVRRLTGGGAVFHDLGNINFTFILPKAKQETIDFRRFTEPIIAALRSLGIDAELSGRNDILASGCKVSGNAACVYGGCTMHHGTLLYSADLGRLAGALRPDPEKLASKGIASVRSRVVNLSSLLSERMTVEEFYRYIIDFVAAATGGALRSLDEFEAGIAELARAKYSTWEWNFGASKAYSTVHRRRFPFGTVEASFTLEGGRIAQIEFGGDFFGTRDISELSCALVGVRFEREAVISALSSSEIETGEYILGANCADIASLVTSGVKS